MVSSGTPARISEQIPDKKLFARNYRNRKWKPEIMKELCKWINSEINSNFMQPECATDFTLLSDRSDKSSGYLNFHMKWNMRIEGRIYKKDVFYE